MFPNVTVPEPTDFFFPRWHSNPLFRGSYSNWPPSFYIKHLDNLRANVGRLYFAGEATSRKYFGFLHGAYFEGLNMGQIIADCVNSASCASADLEELQMPFAIAWCAYYDQLALLLTSSIWYYNGGTLAFRWYARNIVWLSQSILVLCEMNDRFLATWRRSYFERLNIIGEW